MKKDNRSFLKRAGIDALGVLLILGAALFGWVPGPGGIPLFLAGLGLLATNHYWAKRIFVEIKQRGNDISDLVFKDYPALVIAYDALAIVLLLTGGLMFARATKNIYAGMSIVIFFLGVSLLLGNKKRINRFYSWVRKISTKQK